MQDGRARLRHGGDRFEVDAALLFDHRAGASGGGVLRTQAVRWNADGTASILSADGAIELKLALERTALDTASLVIDGKWRRPTWVHLTAIELTLPVERATLVGRDLKATAAPPIAYLERFDPKWISIQHGAANYVLTVDDDVDAVLVRVQPGRLRVRIDLDSSESRPFLHDAACRSQWRAPNQHLPVPARLRAANETVHARLQIIPGAPAALTKSHFPDGRRAALVITDHADQTSGRTLTALAQGRSDQPLPGGGLLGHHLTITKSLFAHGTDRPQLEDPRVVALADQLHASGSEIVPHSATPRRDERPVTSAALDLFARWGARTWIDHQPETNCEAFGDQGYRSTGKFAIADLLATHGYQYVWAEVDAAPGPLNLLHPHELGVRAPTVWPIGRLDAGGPADLWMFRSQWAFLEARHFYNMYSPAALDRLERERGIHVAHTYLETYHPRRTKFGIKNLLVPVDAKHDQPGGKGPVSLAPELERLLASLAERQARGTLWVPTLAALADHLRAMAAITITVGADGKMLVHTATPVSGATFVIPRADAAVRVAGARPRGLRSEDGATVFWTDLPAGETTISF
jgi:hypothetical protein